VVTAPGFGGVKEMLIPAYAEAMAGAGVACLAFDYAGFGESDGDPRQHVDPRAQARAFVDALDALSKDASIDARRLGAWGTSLSGGHTLRIAARDHRVRCAVAIIPFVGPPTSPDFRLVWEVVADATRRVLGRRGRMIASAGKPGTMAIMTSDGAAEWLAGMAANAPSFRNEVTVSSLWNMARYDVSRDAMSIAIPLRVILATRDSITPAAKVRAAFSKNPRLVSVDFVEFPETHFELFGRHNEETIRLTVEWFERHLRA
jgi:dienelactone hydrolase